MEKCIPKCKLHVKPLILLLTKGTNFMILAPSMPASSLVKLSLKLNIVIFCFYIFILERLIIFMKSKTIKKNNICTRVW